MKGTSARQTSFGSRYSFRTLRAYIVMLVYLGCLGAPSLSHAAELRQDTLVYWNAYLDAARSLFQYEMSLKAKSVSNTR